MKLGPDAARYWLAGRGVTVARPFHLRWLLPYLCRNDLRRWSIVWWASWPLAAGGCALLAHTYGLSPQRCAVAAILLIALPGVLGPPVTRPIGVDLPALALAVMGAGLYRLGWWPAGLALVLVASCIKESSPVFAAVWAWSPLLLLAFIAPLIRHLIAESAIDEVTAREPYRTIYDHPLRTSLHAREWRSAWVMVAPWGITLAALNAPSRALATALVVAHAQLFVATDTVRLTQTAAGPLMAVGAAVVIPEPWLILAVVAHVVWWRKPELV